MSNFDKYIQNQLEEMDVEAITRTVISQTISDDVKRSIRKLVDEEVVKIIKTEIEICMSGRIATDDGWGKKNEYKSFKDLFKETFNKKLNEQWDMKTRIAKVVDEKIANLFKKESENIKNALIESISKLYVVKKEETNE